VGDPMQSLITALLGQGVPGITIAILLFWLFRLMNQNEKLQQSRIDDAKAFTDRALKLQEGTHRSIDKLETLAGALVHTRKQGRVDLQDEENGQ
jgi:hypothetical protein